MELIIILDMKNKIHNSQSKWILNDIPAYHLSLIDQYEEDVEVQVLEVVGTNR